MQVEVVYGDVHHQVLLTVELPEYSTAKEAIQKSGILVHFPELRLERCAIGIFSKQCNLDTVLSQGDRIEIYRPLLIEPKEARRLRAIQKKNQLL